MSAGICLLSAIFAVCCFSVVIVGIGCWNILPMHAAYVRDTLYLLNLKSAT